MKKNKILIHNMTFEGIHNVPGVINYDQRGIVFAQAGDVVVTHNKVDPEYLQYLSELGYPIHKIKFVNDLHENDKTWNSIFTSKHVRENLLRLPNNGEYELDVYIPTKHDGQSAQDLTLSHCNNHELSEKYGTKSGFRLLMEEANLPHAQGIRDVENVEQVKSAMKTLFDKGFKKVVVKIDDGISGYGNVVIERNDYEKYRAMSDGDFYQKVMMPIRWDVIGKGVVEGWIENGLFSFSILLFVDEKGTRIVCLQDQLLINGDKWAGCYYPSELANSIAFRDKLEKIVEKASIFLREKGFWGYYSFDILTTGIGEVYLIEANMRKIGSFYPRVFVDGVLKHYLVGTDDINYVASDYTNSALWRGKSFRQLHNKLKDLTWNSNISERGILLYNVGALMEGGRFDFVALSMHSLEDAKLLREQVINKLMTG